MTAWRRQLELFPELSITKRGLLAHLRAIEKPPAFRPGHGWSAAQVRMLMTPLPRITVLDPPGKRGRTKKRRRVSW